MMKDFVFDIEEAMYNGYTIDLSYRYHSYGVVEELDVRKLNDDWFEVNGTVDILGQRYECEFGFNYHTGDIFEYECRCPYCDRDEPCAHIGAIMLQLNEIDDMPPFHYNRVEIEEIREAKYQIKLQEIEKRRRKHYLEQVSSESRNYIEKCKQTYQNEMMLLSTQEKYDITPQLDYSDGLAIGFKVGNNKKYVIKNMYEFLRHIENKDFVKYGKNLAFIHDMSVFSDQALVYIDLMKKCDQILKDTNDYYVYNAHLSRYMYVNNRNIDIIFDTLKDEFCDYGWSSIDRPMEFCLHDEDDYYVLEIVDKHIFIGKKHVYSGDLPSISRFNLDNQGLCRDFIDLFDDGELVIHKSKFEDFYKYVISPIKEYLYIKDMVDIQENEYDTIKIYGDLYDEQSLCFEVYYEDSEQNRIKAFQDNMVTSFQQDFVENYFKQVGEVDLLTHQVFLDIHSEMTYDFIHEGLDKLSEFAEIYVTESLKSIGKRVHYNFNIGVRVSNDLLAIDIDSDQIPRIEIAKVLESYKRKKKFYRLNNGELLSLDSPELEELASLTDQYHIQSKDINQGKITLNKNRAFALNQDIDQYQNLKLDRKNTFMHLIDHFNPEAIKNIKPSSHYNEILRDYQKDGYCWLKTLNEYGFNGILADDMGLGKTLQVIALIDDLKLNKPSLVVCPTSLIYNWQDEVMKFSKDMSVQCIVGNQTQREDAIKHIKDYRLNVTSYELLRRDIDLYNNIEFGYVVLDESQYIKNMNTKNAMAVKQLNSEHKLALSGTPIENSLAELWSVFDFLMPEYLFNYHYFKKNYENDIVKKHDDSKINQLRKLVSPFILRRNKKDVLTELPDKIETTQYIPFTKEENEMYYAHLAQVNKELQVLLDQPMVNKVAVLAMLTKLRQICLEPRMIIEDRNIVSSKMKACVQLLMNYKESNRKVLVFSSFTKVFDLLVEELRLNGISYLVLTGETSKEDRRDYVRRFQEGEVDVFLISLKAGGTGLNLTKAEAVIHFDPWWNISAQNQATDRAYRIGQTNHVQVYKLIMKDSIEEKILKLQVKKKELADMFVENNTGSIASLSKEDILSLFKI